MSEFKKTDEPMPIRQTAKWCPMSGRQCLSKDCAWYDNAFHVCGFVTVIAALKVRKGNPYD